MIALAGCAQSEAGTETGSEEQSTSTETTAAPATTPEPTPTPPTETKSESNSEAEDEVGSTSHAGDTKFCEEHHCIGEFTTEDGTVVECSDGTYSHAGGISGACSDHGGEASGSSSGESGSGGSNEESSE